MRDRPLVHIVFPNAAGRYAGEKNRGDVSAFPMRSLPIFILGALARRAGWDVVCVDESREAIPDERPDLAMITVWTSTAPSAYLLGDRYREQGVPVIMGGVHASLLPGEALRHCDSVVTGECELILADVLADAAAGRLRPVYAGSWAGMDAVPSIAEYADLYTAGPNRWSVVHGIQTSRGCRYNCDYCSVIRINGRGMRHMEPERAVEELRIISRLRPHHLFRTPVYLHDDDLMSDPEYTKVLFEAIIRSGLKLHLGCQASIGMARDPELLELAARAGMVSILMGLESMSRKSLIEANKKNRPHEYKELIAKVHAHGVGLTTGIIYGFDHDEPDIFDQTAEFLAGIEVDNAHFTVLTPLPGTQTFARFWQDGRIADLDWSRYDTFTVVIDPERMTASQLQAGMWESYRRFNTPEARRTRLHRMVRSHPLPIAAAFALGSVRYARRHEAMRQRPSLGFTAVPSDLDLLLKTSQAPAGEAIAVALAQVRPSPPLGLPARRCAEGRIADPPSRLD
jgi:radical SAM superfamily enzyme YgiQ (UPF0313 family)